MRVGILTGGGDAPGLNAAIKAVAGRLFELGHQVSGIQNGWAGCLKRGFIREITPDDVRWILPAGGTILGTSRTNPLKEQLGIAIAIDTLRSNNIDGLVAIGGDDTLRVADAIHVAAFPTVGLPKTIDNDLSATDFCIGFDTAVGIVTESLDRIQTTASAHRRLMVVEVMGRDSGWVALMGGIAGGADLIVIPEVIVSVGEIVRCLQRQRIGADAGAILVVAEGARIVNLHEEAMTPSEMDAFGHERLAARGLAEQLAGRLEHEMGLETRAVVLGHLQRGGPPSATDRIWATRLGVCAADLIAGGNTGVIPIRRGRDTQVVALADVTRETSRVPSDLYPMTRLDIGGGSMPAATRHAKAYGLPEFIRHTEDALQGELDDWEVDGRSGIAVLGDTELHGTALIRNRQRRLLVFHLDRVAARIPTALERIVIWEGNFRAVPEQN
jgi:6-phosphofructokinase 1